MTVFDYKGELQTNVFSLYAWPIDFELEESVHYMGSTVINPSTTECLCLKIEITSPKLPKNMAADKKIMFPTKDQIMIMAKEIEGVTIPAVSGPLKRDHLYFILYSSSPRVNFPAPRSRSCRKLWIKILWLSWKSKTWNSFGS